MAEPSGAIFFCAFARKKRPLRFALKHSFWLKLGLLNRRNAVEENIEGINDMAGGPTRTLPRSGGERRPSRRGVRINWNLTPITQLLCTDNGRLKNETTP